MPFIPKSQYTVEYTNGNLLYNIRTLEPYTGKYIKYGSKYFAGDNILDLSIILKKFPEREDDSMVVNPINSFYNKLKPQIYKKIKAKSTPIASKPKPNEKDYENGIWKRYFCQRINNKSYFLELSYKSYIDLIGGKHDNFLYTPGEIMWSLKNSEININNVLKLERQYPSISFFFNNPLEFVK